MTIEDKKLLIQDLSCRLPYGIKCSFGVDNAVYEITGINPTCCGASEIQATHIKSGINGDFKLNSYKPYLFPLTEENIEKAINESNEFYSKIISLDWDSDEETYKLNIPKRLLLRSKIYSSVVNYFYKHHIDYNGLIEKGLAIDATELNVY